MACCSGRFSTAQEWIIDDDDDIDDHLDHDVHPASGIP